jgi:hypothetical protein
VGCVAVGGVIFYSAELCLASNLFGFILLLFGSLFLRLLLYLYLFKHALCLIVFKQNFSSSKKYHRTNYKKIKIKTKNLTCSNVIPFEPNHCWLSNFYFKFTTAKLIVILAIVTQKL